MFEQTFDPGGVGRVRTGSGTVSRPLPDVPLVVGRTSTPVPPRRPAQGGVSAASGAGWWGVRRYDVPVAVRPAEEGGPGQFLWHDRLYVVREVLAQWQERTAWWTGAAARAVRGQDDGDAGDEVARRWDAADRWVWRVEAGAGRSSPSGTFELSREGPGTEATWRMVRVWD